MAYIKRLVLDVLKPHHPNALDFSATLVDQVKNTQIKLSVVEVDEKTESVILEIDGDDIDFIAISEHIVAQGGSIHSIDEVKVVSHTKTGSDSVS